MMTDRKAEIQRRLNLTSYIDCLEHLLGYRPKRESLTSPEFVDQFRKMIAEYIKSEPVSKKLILFAERVSGEFSALIAKLEYLNPSQIFIWLAAANKCGFAKPIKLSEFRFDFQFKSIPEGIISLATVDGNDKMVMDFEIDDEGTQVMTIELSGASWGKINLEEFFGSVDTGTSICCKAKAIAI